MSRDRRAKMVNIDHPGLSITRQCSLVGISRSGFYYKKKCISDEDLEIIRQIDEQYLKTPFYGSRRMTLYLKKNGFNVCRKRVRRLMRHMGIHAVYPKPKTSKPNIKNKIYPYLLRNMTINRANQVWCSDITYIPLSHGFMYLVAIMDWHTRKVLSWRISNTMTSDFCISALEESISLYGTPEIFNTDQGSQFTDERFVGVLKSNAIQISMDGKGRWMDNVFIERLWRSVKYECIYINEFKGCKALKAGLRIWFEFYNQERPHVSLGDMTPDQVYQLGTKKTA
jgi:putative transposase